MILEYHRPPSIEKALELLSREQPVTYPLGGGTVLSRPARTAYAVVDLQALGLNGVEVRGNVALIGATTTLQQLLDRGDMPPALLDAIRAEASLHIRNTGTVAGTLVSADGRSPFATAMLALDARLTWQPGDRQAGLGDWLPLRDKPAGQLITQVSIPAQARLAYAAVARTPADRPLVAVAVALWPSGRVRVAGGGYGNAPRLVMDGTEANGAEAAIRDAYSHSRDELASAEYRQETAAVLVQRCIREVEAK